MKVVKALPDEISSSGKVRKMVLLRCMKCDLERVSRKDSKQTTEFCSKCNNTTHGDTGSRLYTIYYNMVARCTKPSNNRYQYYGGKGTTVCEEWSTYEVFKTWALRSGYTEQLTIDRISTSQGYHPNNCRWADRTEQSINRDFPIGVSGYAGVTTTHTAQIKQYGKTIFAVNSSTAIGAAYLRDRFILENKLEHRRNFPDLSLEDLNNAIRVLST